MLIKNNTNSGQGFTLVELILVMMLLGTLLAVSAPHLSHFFKAHNLDQEAMQMLAATEYARDEAVSQGVPMCVWFDPASGDFGVQIKDGYEGDSLREKTWSLPGDFHFAEVKASTDKNGHIIAAQFDPDGSLAAGSMDEINILASSGDSIFLAQNDDGSRYEIEKQ